MNRPNYEGFFYFVGLSAIPFTIAFVFWAFLMIYTSGDFSTMSPISVSTTLNIVYMFSFFGVATIVFGLLFGNKIIGFRRKK